LASWAQMRHTWMFQAKETNDCLGLHNRPRPVGFVEPNPAFFAHIKKLAERTAEIVEKNDIQESAIRDQLPSMFSCLRLLNYKVNQNQGWKSSEESQLYDILKKYADRQVPDEMDAKTVKEIAKTALPRLRGK
jgi:hypothetical protein